MTRENPHAQDPSDETPGATAWRAFIARHAVGDVLRATVTKTLPFGSLVESEGVPGLLTGRADLAVGDRVEAHLGALDPDRRRFSMNR